MAPAIEPPSVNFTVIPADGGVMPQENVPVLEQAARAKRDAERSAIMSALKSTNWNRKRASVLLQIDYKALLYKMKKLSIRKEKAASQPVQTTVTEIPDASAPSWPPQEDSTLTFARRAVV